MVTQTISWWRTQFGDGEIQQITDAICGEHISQGPVTAQFERRLGELLGAPYVVATTSGSMSLYMALLALDIGPEAEVLVPNRTWIATAHAALLVGAKVRLVDDEADRPVMDVEDARRKITPRTKVIMPVHLNGRAVNMEAIHALAQEYGLYVVEDAAQAFLSRNKAGCLGTQSHIGCFSLSMSKIISTGQGGFSVTRDPAIYQRLIALRMHGITDVIHPVWTQPGFNFRYNDILAAMGLAQLDRLDDRLRRVKALYARYEAGLRELPFLHLVPIDVAGGEVPLYVEVYSKQRAQIMQFLADRGIQTRPIYPPLRMAPYLSTPDPLPNSELSCAGTFFLPSGPDQSPAKVEQVLAALREFAQH